MSAYCAEVTDRPHAPPAEEESGGAPKPIRIQEQTVKATTWTSWATSARSATDKGLLWGSTVSLVAGMLSAAIGFAFLFPSPASAIILIYTPVVGWISWRIASTRARRRSFDTVAREMRDSIVPDLLRNPSANELHALAYRGNALFINEYTVARVDDRLDLYAIQIFEYAPEELPWSGVPDSTIGFAGG